MGQNKRGSGGVGRHWTHGSVPVEQVTAGVDAKHSRRVRREAARRGMTTSQVAAEQMQRGEEMEDLARALEREKEKDRAIEVLQRRHRHKDLLLQAIIRKYVPNNVKLTERQLEKLMSQELTREELREKKQLDQEKEARRRQTRYHERKAQQKALKGPGRAEIEARALLNVAEDASPENIKAAYRALCHEHHPDKGGNPTTFLLVKEAYELLCGLEDKEDNASA